MSAQHSRGSAAESEAVLRVKNILVGSVRGESRDPQTRSSSKSSTINTRIYRRTICNEQHILL